MQWTKEERAFAVEAYFSCGRFITATQRAFRNHFNIAPACQVPDEKSILLWVDRFRKTGHVQKPDASTTVNPPKSVAIRRGAAPARVGCPADATFECGCVTRQRVAPPATRPVRRGQRRVQTCTRRDAREPLKDDRKTQASDVRVHAVAQQRQGADQVREPRTQSHRHRQEGRRDVEGDEGQDGVGGQSRQGQGTVHQGPRGVQRERRRSRTQEGPEEGKESGEEARHQN